jgi:hypothetical protein
VARASNGFSLFCRYDLVILVGVDLLRLRMFGGHPVWGFIPVQVAIDYPIFGVDYSKLFLKSPCHTRIVWNIRFDLSVACLAGIKDPNLLLFQTLVAMDGLEIFWSVIKLCVVWCYVCWVVCCCVVNFVALFFPFLFCVAALLVGSFVVTNVTFSVIFVGFCIPLCRVI